MQTNVASIDRASTDREVEYNFDDIYDRVAINCFRYLGFTSFDEVDRLSIREYDLLMKAIQLKEVDKAYYIHLQAFKNFQATAMKKVGKKQRPVFSTFDKFFDYEKAINKVLGKKEDTQVSRLREFMNKKKKEGDGNG